MNDMFLKEEDRIGWRLNYQYKDSNGDWVAGSFDRIIYRSKKIAGEAAKDYKDHNKYRNIELIKVFETVHGRFETFDTF